MENLENEKKKTKTLKKNSVSFPTLCGEHYYFIYFYLSMVHIFMQL